MREKTTEECLTELQSRQNKAFCLFCGAQNSQKNKEALIELPESISSCFAISLSVLMNKIAYIQKTKFDSFDEYEYKTEKEILDACAAKFIEHDISVFYSPLERYCEAYQTPNNQEAFRVSVKLQVTFVDKKDALLRTLMIASNDNPLWTIEKICNKVINQSALVEWLEASAKQGKKVFRQHWTSLSYEQRRIAQDHLELFQQLAIKAEQLKTGDPSPDVNDIETSQWGAEWF